MRLCSTIPPLWAVLVNTGVFNPVLAKAHEELNLMDTLGVGVERIQRDFEPVQRQAEDWRKIQSSDEHAKT